MPMMSIEYIQKEVARIGKMLCGESKPAYLFAVASSPTHSVAPHVEIVGNEYHFVVTERGSEFERKKTINLDDILYWLVEGDVGEVARKWELNNRVESRDSRRLWFKKEIELLKSVKPEWAARKEAEQKEVLNENPFRDSI
jgi:hypothetical protein